MDTVQQKQLVKKEWLEGQRTPGVFEISMVNLWSNPEKYNGKVVLIMGYLNLENEGNAIYFHNEDHKFNLSNNAFGLSMTKYLWENIDLKQYNHKYVEIMGVFNYERKGHGGIFQGTIENVFYISLKNKKR